MITNIQLEVLSDTRTLLLTNAMHRGLSPRLRAKKIAKTAQLIKNRTRDQDMYTAALTLVKFERKEDFGTVIDICERTERDFFSMKVEH